VPFAISHRKYLKILGVAFAAWWLFLAVAPLHRDVWLIENLLVFGAVALLYGIRRRLLFSRVSYTLIFLFLCLHLVGAHYSYAEVPYDDWTERLFGVRLGEAAGWRRNHFDRLLHFCYGLLLAYPVREIFLRVADVRGFWGFFLPLDLTMSSSMIFELFEWLAAALFGGGLGQAYVGAQGDEWDAHKDMALATLGALIAMTVTMLVNRRFRRDFNREWAESLRVKHKAPLGEDALEKMQRES
jgi:putative membrane protein